MSSKSKLFFIFAVLYFHCVCDSRKIIQLKRLSLKTNFVTASGFDSGGSGAANLFFSYSKIVNGLALFSSYPYYCGEDKIDEERIKNCQHEYDTTLAKETLEIFQENNLIDDISNVNNSSIYIEEGDNRTLTTSNGLNYYRLFKELNASVEFGITSAHQHPMLTKLKNEGGDYWNTNRAVYGFPSIYKGLKFLLTKDQKFNKPPLPKATDCLTTSSIGGLSAFIQDEFKTPGESSYLAKFGNVYIPPECTGGKSINCTLHVAFHGCNEFKPYTFKNFITCSGYISIARYNRLIVLFPRVKRVPKTEMEYDKELFNCWDFYGYTGEFYGTKLGPQNRAIYKMVEKIIGELPLNDEIV